MVQNNIIPDQKGYFGKFGGNYLPEELKKEFEKIAYEFLKKQFNSRKAFFTELKRGIIDRETLKLAEQPFEVAEQFQE